MIRLEADDWEDGIEELREREGLHFSFEFYASPHALFALAFVITLVVVAAGVLVFWR